MKRLCWILALSVGAFAFGSCTGAGEHPETNAGNENANAGAEPAKALAATLADTEKKAYEAWKNKDGKYFDGFLTDGFVNVSRNGRNVKTGVSDAISKNPCEIRSFSTSDEEAVELAEGVALLTMKVTSEVLCDGKAEPSPKWAASIYVKDGDSWRAAYHQTVAAPDAKGEYPDAAVGSGEKPADDADKKLTAVLSAITEEGWQAWKKKDTVWFEKNWDDKYLAITGSAGRGGRAARIKNVADHKCEVKSIGQRGQRTIRITDSIALFTYEAMLDGSCDGKALPRSMWAGTIWIKNGDKWKSTFYMGTPGA